MPRYALYSIPPSWIPPVVDPNADLDERAAVLVEEVTAYTQRIRQTERELEFLKAQCFMKKNQLALLQSRLTLRELEEKAR